jgi:hypothetical protein
LSSIGKNNQFIFCTHSPEIITASIENSVVFLKPRQGDHSNQALLVRRDDNTHHALNLLGQSIGIISLGRKLLLVEGDESSLDKQTYGAILKNEFPELVLVPVGGKSGIRSFEEVRQSVLNQTIWGVQFFMLCDRDAAYDFGQTDHEEQNTERFKVLPRYHLENYFLDESVLAKIFMEMEVSDSWLKDSSQIAEKLKLFGRQAIPLAVVLKVSAIARTKVGNVDLKLKGLGQDTSVEQMCSGLREKIVREQERVAANLDANEIEALATQEFQRLNLAIESGTDDWKKDIPGRVILNRFAGAAQLQVGRLKTLYLRHAQGHTPDPFDDIRGIFREFRAIGK